HSVPVFQAVYFTCRIPSFDGLFGLARKGPVVSKERLPRTAAHAGGPGKRVRAGNQPRRDTMRNMRQGARARESPFARPCRVVSVESLAATNAAGPPQWTHAVDEFGAEPRVILLVVAMLDELRGPSRAWHRS